MYFIIDVTIVLDVNGAHTLTLHCGFAVEDDRVTIARRGDGIKTKDGPGTGMY